MCRCHAIQSFKPLQCFVCCASCALKGNRRLRHGHPFMSDTKVSPHLLPAKLLSTLGSFNKAMRRLSLAWLQILEGSYDVTAQVHRLLQLLSGGCLCGGGRVSRPGRGGVIDFALPWLKPSRLGWIVECYCLERKIRLPPPLFQLRIGVGLLFVYC